MLNTTKCHKWRSTEKLQVEDACGGQKKSSSHKGATTLLIQKLPVFIRLDEDREDTQTRKKGFPPTTGVVYVRDCLLFSIWTESTRKWLHFEVTLLGYTSKGISKFT